MLQYKKERGMKFARNEKFDKLIVEVQKDKRVLQKLDYEQLTIFVNYLIDLDKHLRGTKGE